MPAVEKHVEYCVKAFGKENEALCYQVNSWMDAPVRRLGSRHRVERHALHFTILTVLTEFLTKAEKLETPLRGIYTINIRHWTTNKMALIIAILVQHLQLDGLLTIRQVEELERDGLTIDFDQIKKELEAQKKASGFRTFEQFLEDTKPIFERFRGKPKDPEIVEQITREVKERESKGHPLDILFFFLWGCTMTFLFVDLPIVALIIFLRIYLEGLVLFFLLIGVALFGGFFYIIFHFLFEKRLKKENAR